MTDGRSGCRGCTALGGILVRHLPVYGRDVFARVNRGPRRALEVRGSLFYRLPPPSRARGGLYAGYRTAWVSQLVIAP